VLCVISPLTVRDGIDKRVHPHGLRHTDAAGLEDARLTVSEISKLLGHSSTAVTARYGDQWAAKG
jgi:integrase/recombinase XerD